MFYDGDMNPMRKGRFYRVDCDGLYYFLGGRSPVTTMVRDTQGDIVRILDMGSLEKTFPVSDDDCEKLKETFPQLSWFFNRVGKSVDDLDIEDRDISLKLQELYEETREGTYT